MYQLDDKPKERNLNFLEGYHYRLRRLYNLERLWDSRRSCDSAEDFIYSYVKGLPKKKKGEKGKYFSLLGELWACHDYLEGEDE